MLYCICINNLRNGNSLEPHVGYSSKNYFTFWEWKNEMLLSMESDVKMASHLITFSFKLLPRTVVSHN